MAVATFNSAVVVAESKAAAWAVEDGRAASGSCEKHADGQHRISGNVDGNSSLDNGKSVAKTSLKIQGR